jgi:GDP-4-dehydro-6-deoxy-D-mannose reductase
VTRSLVTGADGFVGQHLVAELLGRGDEVIGTAMALPPHLETLSSVQAEQVRWVTLDVKDRDTVRRVLREHPVDRVFHLAALSSVAESLGDPESPLRVNVIGTLRLLEELAEMRRDAGYDPTVLISGSGEVYGAAAARFKPLTEESPLEPVSPYAVSKAAQEMLGTQYHRALGLQVIVTRSFNHIGPGQRPVFVAPQLAARIDEIQEAGGEGVVRVGDPDVRRDFTDVRDVALAYAALTESGEPGLVYNVCSGRSRAVSELLETMAEIAGVRVEVVRDPERARPSDIREMVGSHARLTQATGWSPKIGVRESLADLLASGGAV